MSGASKLIYLTLGILFLALGVVGLILPVLPGVLFLACALYLLSRGSKRVRRLADEHPKLRGLRNRMNRLDAASMMQRVQVACLMTIEGIALGIRKLFIGIRRLVV